VCEVELVLPGEASDQFRAHIVCQELICVARGHLLDQLGGLSGEHRHGLELVAPGVYCPEFRTNLASVAALRLSGDAEVETGPERAASSI